MTKRSRKSDVSEQELRKRIAGKAYELYEKGGQLAGHDVENWLEAERLVLAELSPQVPQKPPPPRSRRQKSRGAR